MVMDATQPQQPSPQSVGREFVRQYYTLLNKAPNHLHRFYNNNSSFIHGESTLVVGQKNIHNRIQQLNFHDCHAKISQVDAQATLGNGVVVQVTGELSNDGQPMRRFTQTFVLAAQSPKKYYVHNDIFRYQDMYSDEENDGESRSENDEELHEQQPIAAPANELQPSQQQQQSQPLVGGGVGAVVEQQQQQQQPQPQQQQQQLPAQVVAAASGVIPQAGAPQQQQAAIYYSLPGGRPVPVLAAPRTAAGVPLAAQFAAGVGVPPPPQVQATPASGAQLNGVVAHDDLLTAGNATGLQQQPPQQQQPLMPPTSTPNLVQPSVTAVPVATPVLAASAPVVNAAAIPQNVAAGINVTVAVNAGMSGTGVTYHQAPLVQQHQPQLLQQQQQPTPPNIMQVQSQQQQTVASNDEDVVSGTTPISMNDTPTRVNPSAAATIETSVGTSPAIIDDFKTINEQQQQEKYEAAKQQQNEPKTYANLFKSSSSSPSGFVNAAMQQQQQLQQQQSASNAIYQQSTSTISTATFSQSNTSTTSSSIYNPNRSDNSSLRLENNNQGQSGPLPQRTNTARMNKDFDQRRTSNPQQFGDNQQLFLGNVPHHATEEDLKALFSRFGTVVELRILSKPGSKLQPGARNPLNYGFITYDDSESVQNCLANCPLYFPENSPDAQKLNVEEKKPRMRPDMPPRQPMGSNMNNNMGGNTQRNNMSGGPASRSLSNSGGGPGIMRNNSNTGGGGNSGMQRGSSGGPRMGGGFNRNENRGGPSSGGPQSRGGNGGGSNNSSQSGGGGYGGRR